MDTSGTSDLINLILDNKITAGTLKKVPFSPSSPVIFSYTDKEITISAIYLNASSNCYFIDIKWGDGDLDAIYGIPIKSGINLVEQYPICPINNLYAFDYMNIGGDIIDYSNMILYTIDGSVS